MKSVIIESPAEPENPKYPCLKIWKGLDCYQVVLFTAPKTGILVASNKDRIGAHSQYWVESFYEHFTGTIQLSN